MNLDESPVMALQKGGSGARKIRGGTNWCSKAKQSLKIKVFNLGGKPLLNVPKH